MSNFPEPHSVQYVTIEKVNDGFVITCPENTEEDSCKYIKGTINGVMNFLSYVWDQKIIKEEKEVVVK